MNRDDITRGIIKTWELAVELDIGESFGNPGILPMNEIFRDLILSSNAVYTRVYEKGLSLSHYNILLSDYAYFQFSLDRESYVRYAYYPNPFISGTDSEIQKFKGLKEMVEAGMLEHEDYLSLLADKSGMGGIPMLRYENAPDQRKKFQHPCSHFHIGFHSENRWPVRRILTPYAFSLLVFKHYYGMPWHEKGSSEDISEGNLFEQRLVEEKTNCRLVGHELFEEIEERSFYFS